MGDHRSGPTQIGRQLVTGSNRDDVTNVDVVTFVLAELGGSEKAVHLEEIAVRAFELSPGAFRWDLDEFSHLIDKDKVRVSLTDAAKDKYGRLVRAVGPKRAGVSKPTDAWQLTPSGVAWCVDKQDTISSALGMARPALKRGKATKLRGRVTGSDLYRRYQAEGIVPNDPYAFADLLEVSPDASPVVVQDKLELLMNQIGLLDDPQLMEFVKRSAKEHEDMLVS
jgi:hypothetical protein